MPISSPARRMTFSVQIRWKFEVSMWRRHFFRQVFRWTVCLGRPINKNAETYKLRRDENILRHALVFKLFVTIIKLQQCWKLDQLALVHCQPERTKAQGRHVGQTKACLQFVSPMVSFSALYFIYFQYIHAFFAFNFKWDRHVDSISSRALRRLGYVKHTFKCSIREVK